MLRRPQGRPQGRARSRLQTISSSLNASSVIYRAGQAARSDVYVKSQRNVTEKEKALNIATQAELEAKEAYKKAMNVTFAAHCALRKAKKDHYQLN
jgi:cellobiose-specific phosphotransferase system component IIA